MVAVLMVAEKPSICTSIARALCPEGQMETREGSLPVHLFDGEFQGSRASIKVTCVAGHVFSTDFPPAYQVRKPILLRCVRTSE
jgi:DNA topoisomerase-3